MLLQHFWLGLSKESALQLDVTAGGSFMHKTTSKAEALLDRILENTSFTEALPLEEPSNHEEAPLIESATLTLNHLDSTTEPSPNQKQWKKKKFNLHSSLLNSMTIYSKILETPRITSTRKDPQFQLVLLNLLIMLSLMRWLET